MQQNALARKIFERSFEELPKQEIVPELYVAFAKFEEKCGEMERCRHIYKFALEKIPKEEAKELYREFIAFEKQHGSREGIEDVIMNKRRFQYEAQLKSSPKDYDIWFDYIDWRRVLEIMIVFVKFTNVRLRIFLPHGEETLETIHLFVDQLCSL